MNATFRVILKNKKTFETIEHTYSTAIVLSTLGDVYHRIQITYYTDETQASAGNSYYDYDQYYVYLVR